jgi:predicted ATPase/class 3 adenylate cyclase
MRRDLPSGEVTFLFTDVEGSTRLLKELGPQRYADELAAHRRHVRDAIAAHGGVEVDTQGDAFFVAFSSAADAVAAAAAIQDALSDGPLRVRMGVHTGRPHLTEEGYVGDDVHLGARIAAVGHGGQVLLSGAARAAVGAEVVALGEHRVKDFPEAVAIFQLGPEAFPPIRTIANTNLPRPASSFVGRRREIEQLAELVRGGARLVTLVGPGGAGKTRLAIETAAELQPGFPAGTFWVGLAPVRDPSVVLEEIGRTIGARGALAELIGERELLLLLDNLEQVVDAAPSLAELAEQCPGLRLLVTSRELLRVRGEVTFHVEPLGESDAVDLFRERAGSSGAEGDVAALCRALDNLPLAVELAAARASVLSPAEILERIGRRLDLLRGGRDADVRHSTLRAAIEWSHALLPPGEQRLFARLSLFAGGCTLDAAEEVAGARIDDLQALVEKSLVRRDVGRFWMLETIREYADERRREAADEMLERRFADYFLALVERVEPELTTGDQATHLRRLELEFPNIRRALAWYADRGRAEELLRLTGALRPFFFKHGYLPEGRRWYEVALELGADVATAARARALAGAGLMAALQSDWDAVYRWASEGRALALETDEPKAAAGSMLVLSRALLAYGRRDEALAMLAEVARFGQASGDTESAAMAHFNLGYAALSDGELEAAEREFRAVAEHHPDPYLVARADAARGAVAIRAGDAAGAVDHLRRSLGALQEHDDTFAWALELLGSAVAEAAPADGAWLLGAAEATRDRLALRLDGIELELHERVVATLQERLDDGVLGERWAAGAAAPEDAVDAVIERQGPIDARTSTAP